MERVNIRLDSAEERVHELDTDPRKSLQIQGKELNTESIKQKFEARTMEREESI